MAALNSIVVFIANNLSYDNFFSGTKPSYAQIAEWRKILHRLSFFLRSVDYLILEMLRRLVITATKHLLKFVEGSFHAGFEEDVSYINAL